jgi:hypothetical protein
LRSGSSRELVSSRRRAATQVRCMADRRVAAIGDGPARDLR